MLILLCFFFLFFFFFNALIRLRRALAWVVVNLVGFPAKMLLAGIWLCTPQVLLSLFHSHLLRANYKPAKREGREGIKSVG